MKSGKKGGKDQRKRKKRKDSGKKECKRAKYQHIRGARGVNIRIQGENIIFCRKPPSCKVYRLKYTRY
jgi:hypothetical protein